jgi:hypothetical protein
VRTVNAGPTITLPACMGLSLGPPALIRAITSLILATGSARHRATSSGATFRLRCLILKPMLMTRFPTPGTPDQRPGSGA